RLFKVAFRAKDQVRTKVSKDSFPLITHIFQHYYGYWVTSLWQISSTQSQCSRWWPQLLSFLALIVPVSHSAK
ncbi:MAG: hypothetical protein ACFFC7_34225, partial [Candidatus Hermodarchaeota archaeon]